MKDKIENNRKKSLDTKIMMIEVKKDDLLGDYIVINKNDQHDRDSVMIKIIDDDTYTLGELVITDRMKVFYNHKKRGHRKKKILKSAE